MPPHTFLYNTIIVKYKQVYSHVNSPHIFTAADMLLAHIRTAVLFYLHRRHGWLTPASVYSWSAQCVLLAHIRTVVLFYLHRRHGWFTPASVYSQSALRCSLLISGHSSNKKSETSELVALFYLHRRHGWLTPASVYSQSALRCSLLISGHSSNKKSEASELASDFLFSSLSTITSCPFRRRHRLALLECPL